MFLDKIKIYTPILFLFLTETKSGTNMKATVFD